LNLFELTIGDSEFLAGTYNFDEVARLILLVRLLVEDKEMSGTHTLEPVLEDVFVRRFRKNLLQTKIR
jgi:hypothetical protein